MVLKAQRISSYVLASLPGQPCRARVHSSFRRCINVLSDSGHWISIHPSGSPMHPHAVTVDATGGCEWSVCGSRRPGETLSGALPGERVRVSRTAITLGRGRVRIDLESAAVWEAHIAPGPGLCPTRASRLRDEVWEHLESGRVGLGDRCGSSFLRGLMVYASGRPSPSTMSREVGVRMSGSWLSGTPTVLPSIRAAGGPPSEPPAQVSPVQHNDFPRRSTSKYTLFDHRAAVLLRDLAWSWKAGRPVALKGALRRVVGFGPGLTPSGDDFLVGLLAAATVFDAQNDMTEAVANEVCSLVSAGGACRAGGAAHATTDPPTTHPSIYMLVAAAGGYYPEPLAGLLEALAGKAGPGVAVRVARLSDLGATSGLDMLAGVLFWFEVSGMQRERCGECLTEAGAAAWKGGP